MHGHNIPVFDDELLEIDEVLDSIAWDLCGYRKLSKPIRNATRRFHLKSQDSKP